MSKVALITDTHFGVRNDSQVLLQHMGRFYKNTFWPLIKERNITKIIHLGDLVDRRKFVNYIISNYLRRNFIMPANELGIDMHILVGNHDCPFKNTNSINSVHELYTNLESPGKFQIYSEPTEAKIFDYNVLMLPWINPENTDNSLNLINNTKAEIAMGHLELNGFEVYKGSLADHGMESKIFSKFDMVLSGHYHHKSQKGNIHYLGAPYEMTWSDYDDPRGFHILDLETRELEFIPNPNKLFYKIFYDDLIQDEDLLNIPFERYKGTYCKVIIVNKTRPATFDRFIDSIEKADVADLQVVEDHLNIDKQTDDQIISEAEDTKTILHKFIDQLNLNEKDDVKKYVDKLYSEALELN